MSYLALIKRMLLTLWEPGYNIFVLWNWPKTSSCQLPYHHHSSSADCSRKTVQGLKRISQSSSLHSKKFFAWVVQIFCEWCRKWSSSFWTIV